MAYKFKPKIVGFLCNWCCYAGADLAGVSRYQYPANIRIIRLMCSGRVDPQFILDALARGQAARLVRLLAWAQNPLIKRVNMAFCLIADRLAEVNDRLVQSPHVATIEVPLPNREERRRCSESHELPPFNVE